MNNANNEERLQKALARAGIASRRACEELIAAGRVKVNGKIVTQLGTKIDPTRDKITVDDHPISVKPTETPKKIYLMLNKPEGYLSTVTDPQGRPTIMDLVETDERLYPVGRLDADTAGLLLLTNDGAFAHALTHPRYGVEKEYLALLDGRPPLRELETLRKGVMIPVENQATGEMEEQKTQPARVELVGYEGSNTLVRFIIKEGKKRQVRLMAKAIGFPVLELKRVRFGPLPLADLPEGETRPLSKIEIKRLLEAANSEREPAKVGPGNARPRSMNKNPAERRASDSPFPARPAAGGPRNRTEERPARQKPAAGGPRNRNDERPGQFEPKSGARPPRGTRPERDRDEPAAPRSPRNFRPEREYDREEQDRRRSPGNFRPDRNGNEGDRSRAPRNFRPERGTDQPNGTRPPGRTRPADRPERADESRPPRPARNARPDRGESENRSRAPRNARPERPAERERPNGPARPPRNARPERPAERQRQNDSRPPRGTRPERNTGPRPPRGPAPRSGGGRPKRGQ